MPAGKPKARKQNVDSVLFNYELNKKDEKVYNEICEYCHQPFTFQKKDVKDRLLKCPNCGKEMIYFAFKPR